MSDSLVTIIIPVYKAEQYICQCIESVINQSYSNLEIICVNDGSPDRSLEILKEYEKKDHRIVVVNKENGGVSEARNEALRIARGEFISFVDADDWIDSDTIEKAVKVSREEGTDVVVWSYYSERNKRSISKHIFDGDKRFYGTEGQDLVHRRIIGLIGQELAHPEQADSLCTVWGKLYKRAIIGRAQFVDLSTIGTFEDGLFNIEVLGRADRIFYIDKPFYHYRRGNIQSQTALFRPDLELKWIQLFGLIDNYIREHQLGKRYDDALQNRIALSVIGLGLNIVAFSGGIAEKNRMIRNVLTSEPFNRALSIISIDYFPFHWKAFFVLAKNCNSIGVLSLIYAIKLITK